MGVLKWLGRLREYVCGTAGPPSLPLLPPKEVVLPTTPWSMRQDGDQPEAVQPYFAPAPDDLRRSQALAYFGGGPSEAEMQMAKKDLESVKEELHWSGSLSPHTTIEFNRLKEK